MWFGSGERIKKIAFKAAVEVLSGQVQVI